MSSDYSPFTGFGDGYGPNDYTESTAIELREQPVSSVTAEQGIVIDADGSASMGDTIRESGELLAGMPARTKAAAATVAIGDAVARLQASRKARNFSVGYIAFNERVTVNRPIQPVLDLPATDDYDPTQAGTGGTCIWAGLETAYDQIVQWRQTRSGTLHVSNVVLTMSDGLCSNPERTLSAAARLKELPDVTLAACLFTGVGDPAQGSPAAAGGRLGAEVLQDGVQR